MTDPLDEEDNDLNHYEYSLGNSYGLSFNCVDVSNRELQQQLVLMLLLRLPLTVVGCLKKTLSSLLWPDVSLTCVYSSEMLSILISSLYVLYCEDRPLRSLAGNST